MELIAQQRYFVLHAPRQTGKTTYLLAARNDLNASSEYVAQVNIEAAQAARGNLELAAQAILSKIAGPAIDMLGNAVVERKRAAILARGAGRPWFQHCAFWCSPVQSPSFRSWTKSILWSATR